jgi:hypothetical protein
MVDDAGDKPRRRSFGEDLAMAVEIPVQLEGAIAAAVAGCLEFELGGRGLLLSADQLAAAEAAAAREGARLAASVMQRCYPVGGEDGAIEFESGRTAARLAGALAFGAVAARVLAPRAGRGADAVELCAVFNLGIGLVDSLCDEAGSVGGALLDLLRGVDLVEVAEWPRPRGWLRAQAPVSVTRDDAAAFTVEIVETFFELLSSVWPGEVWAPYRRRIGAQLEGALEAERCSFLGTVAETAPARLIECSRLTSVMPFQIIESLAAGDHAPGDGRAGVLLGEALWRIDDLIDLCEDVRSGALNGVVLAAADERARAGAERGRVAVLESMLTSAHLADTAAEAAERLLAGLVLAGDGRAPVPGQSVSSFLAFVQRYAGLGPAEPS